METTKDFNIFELPDSWNIIPLLENGKKPKIKWESYQANKYPRNE